jgi:hypothetical protein
MAAKNGCENGGKAYMCSMQSPWAVSDELAYGFSAVKLAGGTESSWCCACYKYVQSSEGSQIPLSYLFLLETFFCFWFKGAGLTSPDSHSPPATPKASK